MLLENLVKQKSTPDSGNKCENKEHPGRHKFHKDVEIALNDQIEMEFNASFAYLSMASYFGRSEVALPGCQGFFMLMHQEEHEHAIIFLNYILMRGGHIKVPSISAPEQQEWNNIEKTFNTAVEMECEVKEKLEQLIEICETHSDLQLIDFISGELLEEQNRSIHSLSRLFTRAKMVNDNEIGEFLFDQHIYESFVKHHQPHQKNLMYLNHLPSSNEEVKEVYK